MRIITDLLIPVSVVMFGATPFTDDSIIEVGKVFGVPVMLLCYFLIRDWKRSKEDAKIKKELAARLDYIVDQYTFTVNKIIVDNTKALTIVAETLKFYAKDRPCLVNK